MIIGSFLTPIPVSAETPPDTIDVYMITITPQADGMLTMNYVFKNYCVNSDWEAGEPFSVGVPNQFATLTDWGPKEWFKDGTVEGKEVKLYFSTLPRAGKCLDVNLTIVLGKMAYPDPENGDTNYKFIPSGWEFPIQVKTLIIAWAEPPDQGMLKAVDPKPGGSDGTFMIWQYQNPSENEANMFTNSTIGLVYNKDALTLSEAATAGQPGGGDAPINWGPICWTIFWIVLIIIVVWFLIAVFYHAYESGDGIGPSVIVVLDNTGEAISDFASSVGEGGGSSGTGGGCACAGCACACAGGGR